MEYTSSGTIFWTVLFTLIVVVLSFGMALFLQEYLAEASADMNTEVAGIDTFEVVVKEDSAQFDLCVSINEDIALEDLEVQITLYAYGEELDVATSPGHGGIVADGDVLCFEGIDIDHGGYQKEELSCDIDLLYHGEVIESHIYSNLP
jgi:hypothetical protein